MGVMVCAGYKRGSYLCDIVEVDQDLVNLAIGELAHHVSIFVVGLLLIGAFLTTALLLPIVLVHKVVFVAEIILANVDVAEGVGDTLCGGSLEILQEGLEGSWSRPQSGNLSTYQSMIGTGGAYSIVPRSQRALSTEAAPSLQFR